MTDHALLLVNLGSPASTSVADVRRYLNQFLMDPYVIDLPWPVRRLLVSLILIKRPEQSAHAYASIWWEEGSPLVVLTRQQSPMPLLCCTKLTRILTKPPQPRKQRNDRARDSTATG